jgi:hypothetical protein
MTPTLAAGDDRRQPVDSIDAILLLVAGAVFTAGVIVGALGAFVLVGLSRTAAWERRHGRAR